jgi:hypothetical protein
MTKRLHVPRLPVAPADPNEATPAKAQPIHDSYRQRIMDDDRLTIMHTRIYDYWRPHVDAATAYELALAAWSDYDKYQALKRRVANSAIT